MPIQLGPYPQAVLPGPVEIHVAVPSGGVVPYAAVELGPDGAAIATYACTLLPAVDPLGDTLAVFTPFPLPKPADAWEAGRVRRFQIRPAATDETARFAALTVANDPTELAIGNAFFHIALAPVAAPLSGSADRLIRRIGIAGSASELTPMKTTSDLSEEIASGTIHHGWCFDPAQPPQLCRYGQGVASVSYGGFFQQNAEHRLPGVTWNLNLTFYADLPLAKVRFTRTQPEPARTFTFGRSLQVHLNPSLPAWPVTQDQTTSGQKRDWCSLASAQGQLAFLLTDDRTSGLAYWSPEWGYACASWEATGREFRTAVDTREFFLVLASPASDPAGLDAHVRSLRLLSEADWPMRIRRLFDDDAKR